MSTDVDLPETFGEFREDLLREASFSGDPQHAVFFRMFAEAAAENGDIADLNYTPASREGNRPYQVDGYAWDADRGELHLAVCDYHPDLELEKINVDRVNQLLSRATRFCELAIDEEFVESLEETSPAFELAQLILQARRSISRIRCCQRRYKMGPATGLKVGQSIQTKSLSLRLGLIGVGEAAVA